MSLSGLNQQYIPNTLDGLNVIEADQIYIDGQLVDLSDYVPYQGASRTIDAGSQTIKTTHTATATNDVVNKGLLDTTISGLAISIAGSFLDKVTTTPQTVIGNVSYTAQLSSDNFVVPEAKEADLAGVVQVSGNYRRTESDAGVTANYRFGSITSSLGVYQATTTGNFASLGLATVTVGKRYKLNINVLGDIASYTSSIQLYASIDGQNPTQSLGPSAGFTPSSTIFQLLTGTFVPAYQYLILLCINASPTGAGLTVKWFGLEVYETGVELEKVTLPLLTASKVPILNDKKQLVASGTDASKLDYLDNVGSDIQTQLNSKLHLSGSNANQNIVIGAYKVQSTATPSVGDDYTNKTYVDTGLALKASLPANQTFTGTNTFSSSLPIVLSSLTPSRVLQLSATAGIQTSAVTTTELGYVSGVTSGIQGQINTLSGTFANYLPLTGGTLSGDLTVGGASGVSLTNVATTNGFLSTRFYVAARGDNQDDVAGDNKYGPWYGLGACGLDGFIDVPCLAGFAGVALRTDEGVLVMKQNGAVGIGATDVIGRFNIAKVGGDDFLVLQNINDTAGQYINQRFMFGKSGVSKDAYIQSTINASDETDLAFYVDGGTGVTERFRVRGDGKVYANSSVGIGTTSIDTELYVYGKGKFHNGTVGVPANGVNGGDGTRLVLWPGTSTSPPYGLGIDASTLWYGSPASTSHKWYNGTTNVMTLNDGGNLILNNRLLNVVGGTAYAVPNNLMAAGSLTLGGTDRNYGGGSSWNSSTAGLLFECQTNTEIAIHDAGDRVASFMYYSGNTFTIGRDMGWGGSNVAVNGVLSVANGDTSICNYGPNSTWGAYLRVGSGTNAVNANTAQIISTNGNLHLDAGYGKDMYLNYYCNQAGNNGPINSYGTWNHTGTQIVNTTITVGGANDPNAKLNIRNPSGSYTHFGYSDGYNYIRGDTIHNNIFRCYATSYWGDWLRITNNDTGLYWEGLGRGITSPEARGNPYGSICSYGGGRNTWSGYGINDKWCFMSNGVDYCGIHDKDNSWCLLQKGTIGLFLNRIARASAAEFDRFIIWRVSEENYGGGYWYWNVNGGSGYTSDIRIKKDIAPLSTNQSIAFIKHLQPSTFRMKDTEPCVRTNPDGSETIEDAKGCNCFLHDGFIAQNILEACEVSGVSKSVLNNWAGYEEMMKKPEEERVLDKDNVLGVGDRPILSHTVNVVKGLMEQLDVLTDSLRESSAQLDVLTQRNQVLEAHARQQEKALADYKTQTDTRIEKMASLLAQLISKQ